MLTTKVQSVEDDYQRIVAICMRNSMEKVCSRTCGTCNLQKEMDRTKDAMINNIIGGDFIDTRVERCI